MSIVDVKNREGRGSCHEFLFKSRSHSLRSFHTLLILLGGKLDRALSVQHVAQQDGDKVVGRTEITIHHELASTILPLTLMGTLLDTHPLLSMKI